MFEDGDGDWERHHEIAPAPELNELAELPDWKEPDMEPAMEYRDEVNPYPTTDGDQIERSGFPSDRL